MRLIDADALYKLFAFNSRGERIPEKDCDNFPIRVDIHDVKVAIRNAPTLDVIPAECVVCGEWIKSNIGDCCYNCSKCLFFRDAYLLDNGNFCPNCGAKMDVK